MKVPQSRILRRALAAISLSAALAVTGCTGDQADPTGGAPVASDGGGAPQGGQQPAPSDGGGAPQGQQPQVPEADVSDVPDVVAEVNGEKISKDEFVPVYEGQFQQMAMQQQATGQEVDEAALKKQVAEQLVDNRLLLQGAEDAGITATDADIDATLEEIATQNGLGSADEVVTTLEQQGVSEEQVRKDAASQFKLTAYIEQEADIQQPSDEELKAQYDKMVEQQSRASGQPSQVPPFDEVKEQLAQQAVAQQQNEAAITLADELRKSGDVTINL